MVREHHSEHHSEHRSLWAAIEPIAPKIGYVTQILHEWVKRDQVDSGARAARLSERFGLEFRRAIGVLGAFFQSKQKFFT